MQVFPGPSFPKPGAFLQIYGVGDMQWKEPPIKTYAIGWSGGINTGDVCSLYFCIGHRENLFGEDGRFWAGKDMELSDWQSLVKDSFQIPV